MKNCVERSAKSLRGPCRNKIPTGDLEAVFREQLRALVLSPGDIAEYLTHADDEMRKKEDLLAALEREREKITREMDRVRPAMRSAFEGVVALDERILPETSPGHSASNRGNSGL
jgi:hypothetical protein